MCTMRFFTLKRARLAVSKYPIFPIRYTNCLLAQACFTGLTLAWYQSTHLTLKMAKQRIPQNVKHNLYNYCLSGNHGYF